VTQSDQLTILGYPHQADGSGYYRYYLPYQHLARGTEHRILLPEPGVKFTPDDEQVEEIDMIVGQRFCGPDGMALWQRWKGKVLLVYEIDDDVLQPDTWSGLHHWFEPLVRESFKTCIRISDLVTVSTEPLATQMRKLNPNVVVLPNHFDADALYVTRPRRERLTVGWSGGMSHLRDWTEIADPVREVLHAHPDVDVHFLGIDYSPVLKLDRPTRFTPWKPDVWGYFKANDFDIGLAPLADTPFNASKSHIRALEYMALGVPVIASDCPAYRDLVVDGVTGYLVSTSEQWAARLRELINDEAARTELGAKGREVAHGWTIQSGWKLWRDAYEEVAGWQG
jgi:glycosyltransferase involved in cell wall biosynthesis